MKKITQEQYLQFVGLIALAKNLYEQLNVIEKAAGTLLGTKDSYGSWGHVSDAVWGGDQKVDAILENSDIEVEKTYV